MSQRPLFLRDDLPHGSTNGKPAPRPTPQDEWPDDMRGDAYEGPPPDDSREYGPPGQELAAGPVFPEPVLCSELKAIDATNAWLLHGYVMDRSTTLLSALWKSGKTTFVAHLLRAFGGGVDMFCGRVVLPSNVLVVTEEPASRWARRRDDLGLGDHLRFLVRPFKAKPAIAEWLMFINFIAEHMKANETHLVVFDTLSALWPVADENDAAQVQAALTPLHQINEMAALLLVHHVRKSDGAEATASRGSGALPAFVDTIVELRRHDPQDKSSRKRVLTGYGRWDETPAELVIELDQDAKEYRDCGDRQQDRLHTVKGIIRGVLPRERPGMAYADLRCEDHWPDRVPTKATILDALDSGFGEGLWIRDGNGKKGSPFTYWVQEA